MKVLTMLITFGQSMPQYFYRTYPETYVALVSLNHLTDEMDCDFGYFNLHSRFINHHIEAFSYMI